jgi:gamma-glutamyltranspeptidase / glutathione hydrolase
VVITTRYQVASADSLATQAGLRACALGGNAVDAAIATSAAIAVTGPHLCGLGGDLFALVHEPGRPVAALNASGRAGSGADPAALRADDHRRMPFAMHVASITVPGYVDGIVALHERFATLPLEVLFEPAIQLAEHGFPASPRCRERESGGQVPHVCCALWPVTAAPVATAASSATACWCWATGSSRQTTSQPPTPSG